MKTADWIHDWFCVLLEGCAPSQPFPPLYNTGTRIPVVTEHNPPDGTENPVVTEHNEDTASKFLDGGWLLQCYLTGWLALMVNFG